VVPENENDDITLWPGLSPTDPIREEKIKLLGNGCISQRMRVCRMTEDQKFLKFISYLRFVTYKGSPEDLANLLLSHELRKLAISPISVENELEVIKLMHELCEEQLSKYPTSIMHDLELLQKRDLTYNERNCINFIIGEKETLKYLINLADTAQKVLNGAVLEEMDDRMENYLISIQEKMLSGNNKEKDS